MIQGRKERKEGVCCPVDIRLTTNYMWISAFDILSYRLIRLIALQRLTASNMKPRTPLRR